LLIRSLTTPKILFASGFGNPSWLDTACNAGTGASGHFDPDFEGFPAVEAGSATIWTNPMGAQSRYGPSGPMLQYNLPKSGSALPDGSAGFAPFGADTWEMYAQDSWKEIKPKFDPLHFGLR